MFQITPSAEDVIANLERFAAELAASPELQDRLAYARAWYAHQDSEGRWQFGPSKFVGYLSMTASDYIRNADEMNGRRTEAQLKEWFEEVDRSDQRYKNLEEQLFSLLAQYKKTPSKKFRINVLRDDHKQFLNSKESLESAVVTLMVKIAKMLPQEHVSRLKKALS